MSDGLRHAHWRATRLEAQVERQAQHIAAIERRLARLERREAEAAQPRIPRARAAELLGASPKHVTRLGEAGLLDVVDVAEPGAARSVWTVSAESLERLLESRRGRPGRPGREIGPDAGQPARDGGDPRP